MEFKDNSINAIDKKIRENSLKIINNLDTDSLIKLSKMAGAKDVKNKLKTYWLLIKSTLKI